MGRRPKDYIQLPCRGCGIPIEGYRRIYCTLQCGDRYQGRLRSQRQLERNAARRLIPRPCGNPSCTNTFTGKSQKKYCSSRCNQLVNHKRPTIEYERKLRDNREARRIQELPHCSICGKTTARKGYYNVPMDTSMIPSSIHLCSSHYRGYTSFIRTNSLADYDPDDVFTAYLVRKTFVSSTRQPWIVMIKDCFKN